MGPFSAVLIASATAAFATMGPVPGGLPVPAAKALEKKWTAAFDGQATCGKLVRASYDDSLVTRLVGCNDDAKCVGKLGGGIGAKHVFLASVSKSLNGLRLTTRAIDADGVPRATFNVTGAATGELGDKMKELAAKLCTAVTGIQPAVALDLDLDMGAPAPAASAGLDLDLDLGAAPAPKPTAAKPAPTVAALDLDLDVGLPAAPAPAPKPAAGKPSPAPLELDLDLDPVPAPAPVASKAGAKPAPKPSTLDLDFDLDVPAKPVATAPPVKPAPPKPAPPKPTVAPRPEAKSPVEFAELPPLAPAVLEPVPQGPPAPVGAIVATVATVLSGAGAAAAGWLVLGAQQRRDVTTTFSDYTAAQAETEQLALYANLGWGVAGAGAVASAVLWVLSGSPPADAPAAPPSGAGGY